MCECLLRLWLFEDVLGNDGPEDGEVPQVDKKKTRSGAAKEEARCVDEVDEALVVHPEDDEDPDEEGGDVGDGICPVLQGMLVSVGEDVEDPGLVGDSVQFSHQGQDCEANGLLRENCSSEGDDDCDMMDREEGEVFCEDHVHELSPMDTQGEEDEVDGHLGVGLHQVRSE